MLEWRYRLNKILGLLIVLLLLLLLIALLVFILLLLLLLFVLLLLLLCRQGNQRLPSSSLYDPDSSPEHIREGPSQRYNNYCVKRSNSGKS